MNSIQVGTKNGKLSFVWYFFKKSKKQGNDERVNSSQNI